MAQRAFQEPNGFDDWLAEDFISSEDEVDELPVLPLRDSVLYPHMMAPLLVGREASLKAVEAAMEGDRRLVAVAQRDEEIEEPTKDDLPQVAYARWHGEHLGAGAAQAAHSSLLARRTLSRGADRPLERVR